MKHTIQSVVELIESTSGLMINDTYSFIFLRSDGLDNLKKNSLGGGNLLMVIGQFAVLNFLSKVYLIARKGESEYFTQKEINLFEDNKKAVQQEYPEAWKKIKDYCKKPRLWDVKDESRAFIKLILDYPDNIGIPKNDDAIRKVWNSYRNKISHIATIENGNMSLTFESSKEQSFQQLLEIIEKTEEKAFFIRNQEEKDKIRKEITAKNNENGVPTSGTEIGRMTSDQIRPDILTRDIKRIKNWLVEKIKKSEFDEENIKFLYDWLLTQHYVNR